MLADFNYECDPNEIRNINISKGGIKEELKDDLNNRVKLHRNRFAKIWRGRYLEKLPLLIKYQGAENFSIDFLKCEIGLRQNYDMVIGLNNKNDVVLLGYCKSLNTITTPDTFLPLTTLDPKSIQFIIPEEDRCTDYKEITKLDDCKTGNFVVLRNKAIAYTSDFDIIEHYVSELAEIALSRMTIIIQSKMMTIFVGSEHDPSVNNLIEAWYNGYPSSVVSPSFDKDDNMIVFDNTNAVNILQQYKSASQNQISELNSLIGVASLGVDKLSGVSDVEALSGDSNTIGNGNIYISPRQEPLNDLCKRLDKEPIKVIYDNNVASEISKYGREVFEDGENREIG